MREYIFRLQVLDRLSDTAYMSSIGQITKESASRYLESTRRIREDVVSVLSPNYQERDRAQKKGEQQGNASDIDVKKMNYIKALQGLHSGSLQDFVAVRNEFNAALAEKNKK